MAMFSVYDKDGALLEVDSRADGQLYILTSTPWSQGGTEVLLTAEQKRALLKYITEGDDGE